jgi:hypothetical protein
MRAKLIKTENGYGLEGCGLIAFVSSRRPVHKHHKLSLKNCQSIERGYDLDELAELECSNPTLSWENDYAIEKFKAGFKIALELIDDKKFTEDSMSLAYVLGVKGDIVRFNKLLDSRLEKTEWDVEIKMRSKTIDELRESGEGFLNNKNLHVVELDEHGCLILKKA